jgi:hypothetical protein
VAWAAATFAGIVAGSSWLAIWLAPIAALAAISALRSWTTKAEPGVGAATTRPRGGSVVLLAGCGAAAITISAVAGPIAIAVIAILVATAFAFAVKPAPGTVPSRPVLVMIVLGPAAAAGSLVLTRDQGLAQCLVLAGMVMLYDSAVYVIGTGARNRLEGPVAGVASIGALTLLVSAILAPPFRGASPWILGLTAAVLAPAGPIVARALVGDQRARVPALRRLDSLLLLGPAWFIGASLLVHR